MDDFYNSVEIALNLRRHKIRMCGTIRANRGLPEQQKNPKLKPGQMIYRRKGEILLQTWNHKKKDIRMISIIHNSTMQ